jgi:hypothetical protein
MTNKKILTSMLLCFALSFCIFPSLINAEEQSDLDRLVEEYKGLMQELEDLYEETGLSDLMEEYENDPRTLEWKDNWDKINEIEDEYKEEYYEIFDDYYSKKAELDNETGILELKQKMYDLYSELDFESEETEIWNEIEKLEEEIESIKEEYSDEYKAIKEEYKQKQKALDKETGIFELRKRNEEIEKYFESMWEEMNKIYEDNYESFKVIYKKMSSLYDEAEELGIEEEFFDAIYGEEFRII